MFNELVKDKTDIYGMIAYSLYKFEKQTFIKNNFEIKGEELKTCELKKLQDSMFTRCEEFNNSSNTTVSLFINKCILDYSNNLNILNEKLKEKENLLDEREKTLLNKTKSFDLSFGAFEKKEISLNESIRKNNEKLKDLDLREKQVIESEKKLSKDQKVLKQKHENCPRKNGFWASIGTNILASFFFIILSALLVIGFKVDLGKMLFSEVNTQVERNINP